MPVADQIPDSAKLQKLQDWLREPDFAEHFSTADLVDWLNRRPTSVIPSILATRAAPPAMDREAVKEALELADATLRGANMDRAFVERKVTAAIAALSADAIRQGEGSEVERDVTYEVWQDDEPVAGSTDEADARHYLDVYGQDGPAKLMRVVTVRTEIAATPASHASDGGKA